MTNFSDILTEAKAMLDETTCRQACGPTLRVPLFLPLNDVTMCGCMSTPPLATVDATSAISMGVTSVSAWPYAAFASSTASLRPPPNVPPPFVSCDRPIGRSNGIVCPKPSRWAIAAS